MKKIIGVIIAVLLLTGIGQAINRKNQPNQNSGPKTEQTAKETRKSFDTSYGTDKRNTMTVRLPEKITTETPMILFMHGGAWTSGDKKDVAIVQEVLAKSNIASASINYRYASPTVHYTDLMKDVENAVTYIQDHKSDWGLSGSKIAIGGISAGAHMALLYTYAYDSKNDIDAVISLAGPTDLTNTEMLDTAVKNNMINFVQWLVNDTYKKGTPVGKNFSAVSPIKHLKNVPTLLVQGNGDSIVLYSQSTMLDTALADAGIPHKLITIPGANHDMGIGNPKYAIQIGQEMVAWIKKYNK